MNPKLNITSKQYSSNVRLSGVKKFEPTKKKQNNKKGFRFSKKIAIQVNNLPKAIKIIINKKQKSQLPKPFYWQLMHFF